MRPFFRGRAGGRLLVRRAKIFDDLRRIALRKAEVVLRRGDGAMPQGAASEGYVVAALFVDPTGEGFSKTVRPPVCRLGQAGARQNPPDDPGGL